MNHVTAEKSNHLSLMEEIQDLCQEKEQGINEYIIKSKWKTYTSITTYHHFHWTLQKKFTTSYVLLMATTGNGEGKKQTLKSTRDSLFPNHSLSSAADKQTTLAATEAASACPCGYSTAWGNASPPAET